MPNIQQDGRKNNGGPGRNQGAKKKHIGKITKWTFKANKEIEAAFNALSTESKQQFVERLVKKELNLLQML